MGLDRLPTGQSGETTVPNFVALFCRGTVSQILELIHLLLMICVSNLSKTQKTETKQCSMRCFMGLCLQYS